MRAEGSDAIAEARRVLSLAEASRVPLRVLGGVAIGLRTPDLPPELARPYGDVDFAAAPGTSTEVSRVFTEAGYEPDRAFNTLHGKRRLIFIRREQPQKADVFVGAFEMCHKIPVAERLELEPLTLPLAELLVTKLQIVQLNEKDLLDALTLFARHDVGEGDRNGVNAARVAELCAADWGLWRTLTANLEAVRAAADEYRLSDDVRRSVSSRIDALVARIEAESKPRAWRLRARVGERIRWYELPEDV